MKQVFFIPVLLTAVLASGAAWSQTPAAAPAPAPAAPAAMAPAAAGQSNDALVQMHNRIRAANKAYDRKVAAAKKVYNDKVAQAKAERDKTIADARATAGTGG
ncbi:hypothetical protein PPN31114_02946 [Pandoraea pneumonica]|jgi:hypothetical protein|uniref:Uncharacterized protein n=1 Tax=Pandoraea pneumonica TaxID=2508299 RepID=A0A5E4W0N2_9BURK|nr:hypothetical protein [Pandoraea pneumonica]VVE16830.1 hypothetical protein PPN31114_02946 [Pandoraea pneumonica]